MITLVSGYKIIVKHRFRFALAGEFSRHFRLKRSIRPSRRKTEIGEIIWDAFFWDYSGIGILGIDGIYVLLGAIPFSE